MAPPTGPHRTIVVNTSGVLYDALQQPSAMPAEAEAGLRINEHTMWQADIAVTCQPAAPEIDDPLLVVEVLSPSTRTHDLGRKLVDYKTLPSVAEIWMVDCERRWVQLWRRDGERLARAGLRRQRALRQRRARQARSRSIELYADSGL